MRYRFDIRLRYMTKGGIPRRKDPVYGGTTTEKKHGWIGICHHETLHVGDQVILEVRQVSGEPQIVRLDHFRVWPIEQIEQMAIKIEEQRVVVPNDEWHEVKRIPITKQVHSDFGSGLFANFVVSTSGVNCRIDGRVELVVDKKDGVKAERYDEEARRLLLDPDTENGMHKDDRTAKSLRDLIEQQVLQSIVGAEKAKEIMAYEGPGLTKAELDKAKAKLREIDGGEPMEEAITSEFKLPAGCRISRGDPVMLGADGKIEVVDSYSDKRCIGVCLSTHDVGWVNGETLVKVHLHGQLPEDLRDIPWASRDRQARLSNLAQDYAEKKRKLFEAGLDEHAPAKEADAIFEKAGASFASAKFQQDFTDQFLREQQSRLLRGLLGPEHIITTKTTSVNSVSEVRIGELKIEKQIFEPKSEPSVMGEVRLDCESALFQRWDGSKWIDVAPNSLTEEQRRIAWEQTGRSPELAARLISAIRGGPVKSRADDEDTVKPGEIRYKEGVLQFWDGMDWTNFEQGIFTEEQPMVGTIIYPDDFMAGDTVYHKLSGAGPYVLVQVEETDYHRHIPSTRRNETHTRQTSVPDTWMAEDATGAMISIPEAVLTHQPPRGIVHQTKRVSRAMLRVATFLMWLLVLWPALSMSYPFRATYHRITTKESKR